MRLSREPGEERVVGRLVETGARSAGGQVFFEYDPTFLRDPLWLSPSRRPVLLFALAAYQVAAAPAAVSAERLR